MANDSEVDSWTFHRNSRASNVHRYNLGGGESNSFERQRLSVNDRPRQCRTHVTHSGSDVRLINPAIYAEPSGENNRPSTIIESSCGDSSTLVDRISSLAITGVSKNTAYRTNGPDTYRCDPSISPLSPSTTSSRGDSRSSVKVRCCTIGETTDEDRNDSSDLVQRYAVNGHRVVEFSASSCDLSDRQGSVNGKKNAYEEWVERKKAEESRRKEEARRLEQEKQAEEERIAKEKEERERRERENFLRWSQRKRKEEADKRELLERELELEKRLKEAEEKAVMAKTLHLRLWARKKEKQQKALQKKRELVQKREEEEREKRLEKSSKAYEKWREISKNRPRPATQGLLPHQQATPSFINPNPWIVDDVTPAEPQKNPSTSISRKSGSQAKSNLEKNIFYKS